VSEFELIVDATYTGILKPDPHAYQACLNGLGLVAEECVMIDDQVRNVRGALALGIPSVMFNVMDPEGSCEKVRSYF
jgi:putative hydrolase of the HAD superfamily